MLARKLRKTLALFLALTMVLSLAGLTALASDGGEQVCTCESKCTEDALDDTCPVCAEDPGACACEAAEPVCTCGVRCTEDAVDAACPACAADFAACACTGDSENSAACCCTALCGEDAGNPDCPVCAADFTACAYESGEPERMLYSDPDPRETTVYVAEGGDDEHDGSQDAPCATIAGAAAHAADGGTIYVSGRVLWGDGDQWPDGTVTITAAADDAAVIMNGANGQDPEPNVTHLGCGVILRNITLEESCGVNYLYACGNYLEIDHVNFAYNGSVTSGETAGSYWSLIGGSDLTDVAGAELVIGVNNAEIVSVVGGGINHDVTGNVSVRITAEQSIYNVYGGGVCGDVGGTVTLAVNNVYGRLVGGGYLGHVGGTDVTLTGRYSGAYSLVGGCHNGHSDRDTSVTIAKGAEVTMSGVCGGSDYDVNIGSNLPWNGNWRGEFDLIDRQIAVEDIYVGGDTYVAVNGTVAEGVYGGGGGPVMGDTHVTVGGTVCGVLNNEGVYGGGSYTGGDVLGSTYVTIEAGASIPMTPSTWNGAGNLLGGAVFGGGRFSVVHGDTHVTVNGRVGTEGLGGLVLGGGYASSSDVKGTAYVTVNAAPYAYTHESRMGWQQYGSYDFLCGLSGVYGGGFNNNSLEQTAHIDICTDMGDTAVYGDGLCGYLKDTTVKVSGNGIVSRVWGYYNEESDERSVHGAAGVIFDGNTSAAKQILNADLVQVTNGSSVTIDNESKDNEQLVNVSNLTIDQGGRLTLGASAHILSDYTGDAANESTLVLPAGRCLTADGAVAGLSEISIVDAADGTVPAEAQIYVISGKGSTTADGDFSWIDRRNSVKMEWKANDDATAQWWLVKSSEGGGGSTTDYYTVTVNYLDKASGEKLADSFVSGGIREGRSWNFADKRLDAITRDGVAYSYDSASGDALTGTNIRGDKVVNLYYAAPVEDITDSDVPQGERPDTETIEDPAVPGGGKPADAEIEEVQVPLGDAPNTGDSGMAVFLILTALLSGAGMVLVLASGKKRSE